jgi:prevent-host-death family protein
LREFSLSDLNRRPGELVDLALVEPLVLKKRGRRQLVLMSASAYDAMVSGRLEGAEKPAGRPVVPEEAASGRKKLSVLQNAQIPEEP